MAFFLLFLACLAAIGHYLPIDLHLHLRYDGSGLRVRLGLKALFGLIHREREFPGHPSDRSASSKETGRKERAGAIPAGWLRRLAGAGGRYRFYGLGGGLLSYFIPDKYRLWLDVAEEMESGGRFTELRWLTVLGLGEAAATAWAVGIAYSLKSALLAAVGRRYGLPGREAAIAIQPWFAGPRLQTSLDCIFRLRAGHIIRVSIRGFIRRVCRRTGS